MIRADLFDSFISSFLIGLPSAAADETSMDQIKHIVVIYAENRSFDNLYGLYPGANGIAEALANYIPQVDHDGTPFSCHGDTRTAMCHDLRTNSRY